MKSNRRIAHPLTLGFAVALIVLLILGLSRSNESPAKKSTHAAALPTFAHVGSSPSPATRASIGDLTVASAGIYSLPITRGIDKATLSTGMAGSYSWSGPGESGVFALAAHRIGAGGPFRHLDQVHVGDRITVAVGKHQYAYRVKSNITVDPSDTSVLSGPQSESRIVLITCTPLDTFAKRIVVTGTLIRAANSK